MSDQDSTETLGRLLAAVATGINTAAIGVDAAGAIVYLNQGAARLLDVPEGSHLGQPVANLIGVGPPAGDDDSEVEFTLGEKDQGQKWIRGRWSAVEGLSGVRLLLAEDCTRDHNLQRDLVRSAALAELGLMAAEVAHEVNNPATYLMTNLSILRDDLSAESVDVDSASELIEECLDGVQRITEVVRRMRSLASSGGEEISDELIDLSTVVRDACRIAGLRVKYKADLHIHDESTVQVKGSPKRLGQVVLNLVVNAADALTGQADPMPRVDVYVEREEGWGIVRVRDNGPGIPEATAGGIFEPFVTTKIGKGGTGLGLAVSRTIAEEHGGQLELEPHDGAGAWFVLRLPLP